MGDSDKIFMKRFSGIIVGLVIVTILIIVIAVNTRDGGNEDNNPSRVAMANERTLPVGAVRTEMPAPVEEAAPAEPVDPASIDGGQIYATVCQACHMTGAANAPIPGSDAWAERAGKGLETLAASAINGMGTMPPKGGRTDLSDAEVTAAVQFMLDQ